VRADLQALGTQVAFVHMQTPAEADVWFARHGLSDLPRFSDPDHRLYRAFDLEEGSLLELGHPRAWPRWARSALSRGAGFQGRHWRQLTGMFLIRGDGVLCGVRHREPTARPDYLTFAQSCLTGRYNT
jgi:hypothetical protein